MKLRVTFWDGTEAEWAEWEKEEFMEFMDSANVEDILKAEVLK